jgi:hypothetical protein
MTKRKSIALAIAGATVIAPGLVRAQTPYADQDLLLSFRSINSQSPPDVTVDLGNINTFLAAAGTAGGTLVLDIPGATHGYTDQFNTNDIISNLGDPSADNPIGMSAGAAQASTYTLWLTRVISGPNPSGTGLTASAKQSSTAQSSTAQDIFNIGTGYTSHGTQLDSGGNGSAVSAGDPDSYYTQSVDGAGVMDYLGSQSPQPGAGGALEAAQTGAGNVYLALWKVPPTISRSNPGTADTYEGFFTFTPSGEVDFNLVGSGSVPVPKLSIAGNSSSVVISWADTGSFTLQQNSNLSNTNGWSATSYTVVTNAGGTGSNTVTITPPTGNLFFRLHNP